MVDGDAATGREDPVLDVHETLAREPDAVERQMQAAALFRDRR